MKPNIAIALYVLGKLHSKQIVDLSHEWLMDGIFTDSINFISAEKKPEISVVGPLLEKAIVELGEEIPTRIEAAKIAIRDTAERMVSGIEDPLKGAEFIYWNIHHEINDELPDQEYLGDNLGLENIFCWLREIWDCRDGSMVLYYSELPRNIAEKKFFEHLVEETEKWLQKNA